MKVVIVGASGHGQVVLDILNTRKDFIVAGFLDNNPELTNQAFHGTKVLGNTTELNRLSKRGVEGAVVAVGDIVARATIAEQVIDSGLTLINAIHPTAIIAPNVQIGKNVVIAAGAIISTGAYIGDNVIINTGAIIDHECKIYDNVHISPGVKLAGRVIVENGAHIGIGSTVIQGITIGQGSVIGAGSVVLEDIPPNCMAAGVPARVKKLYNKEMEK